MTPAVVTAPPSAAPLHLHRRLRWTLAGGALLLYTLTTCPTVHWGDSGELITAGVTLGIAHPPGHPLYSMLAHLFSWLPLGAAAWRINWMSAVFGAIAVVLTFELAADTLRRLGAPPRRATACAAAAAALFGLTTGMWEGSTVAETTTLHAAFMAALWCVVWRIAWTRPTGATLTHALGTAAALYGFSATNHVAGVFFLPAFAFVLIGRGGREVLAPRNVAVMFACVFAGLSLYAYLPLRSLQDPVLDWGNPETLRNFWWVVTAKQFQAGLVQDTSAIAGWTALAERGRIIARELTVIGTGLGLWGILHLARRAPWFGGFVVLALFPLIALGLSSAFILAYFVPGLLLLAVGLANGLNQLVERLPRVPARAWVAAGVALAFWSGTAHVHASARQDSRAAAHYGRSILDAVPPDGVLFTTNMNMLFTAWALQTADGYRPDVAVIDWSWVAGDSPLTEQVAARHPDLRFLRLADLEPYRERWGAEELSVDLGFAAVVVENIGRRPLYLAVPGRRTEVAAHLAAHGGIFEIRPTPGPYLDDATIAHTQGYWTEWAERLEAEPGLGDAYLTETLAYDLNNQGIFFERFARADLARWNYDMAVRIDPGRALPYLNRGRLAADAGDWATALADYRTAVAVEPRNPRAHYYVGTAEEGAGHPDRAYEAYLEALLWDPNDPQACGRVGGLLLSLGRLDRARTFFDHALAADPDAPLSLRGLVRIALALDDFPGAATALRRAREVEPDSIHVLLLTAEYAAKAGQPEAARAALQSAYDRDGQMVRDLTRDRAWAEGLLALKFSEAG